MNREELLTLVQQPEKLATEFLSDLKVLMEMYPAFVPVRILYTKALQLSNSVYFNENIKLTTLYCANRRWLYYFMHPEKMLATEPYRRENSVTSHGDYFDMIETIEREGTNTKLSLKNLAERLKSARTLIGDTVNAEINNEHTTQKMSVVAENTKIVDQNAVVDLELMAKKMISAKKYSEAIEILRKLNLNNPKKSVYFADQIRFLEKVIANLKK